MLVVLVAACGPPPALAPRPQGAIFETEPLFLDGRPWRSLAGDPGGPGPCVAVEEALVLKSSEPRFGGWSGAAVRDDDLTLVSDRGYRLTLHYTIDPRRGLALSDPRFGVLQGTDGAPLRAGRFRDAESVTALPGGGMLVSFEREHRLWLYPASTPPFSGKPVAVEPPPDLKGLPYNGGLEAVAGLPDGRILALAEGERGADRTRGWIGTPAPTVAEGMDWAPLTLLLSDGYRPTAAAATPDGDVLVLERFFSPGLGFASRIRRIPTAAVAPGAVLDGPVLLHLARAPVNENFEALAVLDAADGETRVLLVSDDNYNRLQRSLLLVLRW